MEVSGLQRDAPYGQVAVGQYVVQIHAEHGAVVTYAPPEERPLPHPRAAAAGNMPGDLPSLLGREDELRIVRRTLESGAPVEVVGGAGTGKTALLRHLAHGHAAWDELGGVLFLRVAGRPGEDVLQSLFEGFYECEGALVPTVAELERYLLDRRALVVLDDADLARRERERVMSLAPRCLFAIGAGERRLWGGGRSIALEGLDEQSCLALAERELARALSDDERASLGRLALALEGHPLRIVQAAHLMIKRQGGRSGEAAPAGSPKDQFDELVAQSLDPDEERVLGPLVALPGVGLEAGRLADITDLPDAGRVLASLEGRGLVRAHGSSYRLAGTAGAALGHRVDTAVWRDRAVQHYAGTVEDVSADEAPAILALLDAGAAAGDQRAVIQLARNADASLALGPRWGAWREILDRALVAARELRDQHAEAWALHQLGSRAACLGDRPGGTALLSNALHLREHLGDPEGAALTRQNLEALSGEPPPPAPPAEPVPPPAATPPAQAELPQPPPPPPAEPPPPPPVPPAEPPAPAAEPPPRPPARPQPAPPPPPPPPWASPAPPPPAPPPPPPPPPSRPRPSEPPEPKRAPLSLPSLSVPSLSLPPLKPVIAAIAAIVLLVVIVRVVSGGDDESASPTENQEAATTPAPKPNARPTRGGRAGGGGKKLPVLPAVIGPNALQFTAPPARLSKPQYVRAENKSGARITVGKVRLDGKDRADFVATDGCNGAALSRGETCKVVVSFIPVERRGATAQRTAVLIFGDDGKGGKPRVSLTGSVVAP